MTSEIKSIAIDRFVPHPDNPNRMSKANFLKLIRNIERTGRYEPLVVRPRAFSSGRTDHCQSVAVPATAKQVTSPVYQIINGYHRWQALKELGYKTADAIVWDIDDEQTDILLATLNRLGGSDVLDKKLALLRRLNERWNTRELAKILPQTKKQIERLCQLTISDCRMPPIKSGVEKCKSQIFANPMVFFLNDEQSAVVEDALFLAQLDSKQKTTAAKRADGLAEIARFFLSFSKSTAK